MDNTTIGPASPDTAAVKFNGPKHTPLWTVEKVGRHWVVSHPDKQWMHLIRETRADAIRARDEANDYEQSERIKEAAPDMLDALRNVQKIISEAAMTGFNWKDGDWADRLFFSQQKTSGAIRKATGSST